jgi:RNA polymerase sigma factor (sigma-70 family)
MNKLFYNQKNDLELIQEVKCQNCSEAMKELETRHSGVCFSMIKKYYNALSSTGLDPNEVAKEKDYVMYKSILNFDPSKNIKFSTWVGNQMRFHCLNSMNKNNNSISMDNENIKNIIERKQCLETVRSINKDNYEYIFNILSQFKDKRIEEIFKMRYFSDKKVVSWSKIAKKLKISTQTVINLHNKALKFLKNKLESNQFQDTI